MHITNVVDLPRAFEDLLISFLRTSNAPKHLYMKIWSFHVAFHPAQDAEGWRIIFVKKAWKFGIRGIFWCWIDLEGVPLKNMPRLLHAAAIMLHNSEICSTRAFWRKIFAICIKILVWGNFLMLNWSRRSIHQKHALVAACSCNYAA